MLECLSLLSLSCQGAAPSVVRGTRSSSLFSAFGSDAAIFLSTSAKYGADVGEGEEKLSPLLVKGRTGSEGKGTTNAAAVVKEEEPALKNSDDNWEGEDDVQISDIASSLKGLLDETGE